MVCGRLGTSLVPSTFSPDFLIMKDFTQGSVLSHALTMAVPIFTGLVLVLLCGLIDLYLWQAWARQPSPG
jgi:hypothetical protein